MECPGPSKSSSRAGESLIFMFFQFQLSTGTFGSTWSVLGASWAQLGASWAPLGRLLASTWALLGPTWRQLGRLRSQLGRFGGQLDSTLDYLGRSWNALGHSWTPLDLPRAILARFWCPREGFWRLRETISTPTRLYFGVSGDRFCCVTSAATAHRKRIRQQRRIRIVESEITTTMQQQRK